MQPMQQRLNIHDAEQLDVHLKPGPVDAAHAIGQGVEDGYGQVIVGVNRRACAGIKPCARRQV